MSLFKLALTLLIITFSINGVAQKSDKGIFVDPATMDFNLLNGQSGVTTVKVLNEMDVKKQFKIYLNDWERDTIGNHRYTEPNTLSNSCSRWVSIDKTFLELNPGESAIITVKVQVPDSVELVKRMRWSMLFIETVEEKKSPSKITGVVTTIQTSYRIGVHIYQTPPNAPEKEIQMVSFATKDNANNSTYRIECKNTGGAQVRCKSNIELINTSTGKKTSLTAVEFPMFPDQKRYIDFTLPSTLEKGKYTIVATVDAGEDVPLEAAEKTIEIK